MDKNKLYQKYKYLIPKVIKDINCQYRSQDEWQEYFDAGEIGLVIAINTFDINRGDKSTYFYTCIKHNILILFKSKVSYKRRINYLEKDSLE